MASTTVFGNLTVADGAVVNAPNNGRSYALYRSSTYTADLDASIPTLIRCYLPAGVSPFPNNITVFLYGKICTPAGQPYLIEAINMFPYPGNPYDATYGDVPAFAPRICILGHVSGNVETTYEGRRVFRVQSAAWVRDQLQATNFMAFFENSFRWKKTNTPNAGSAIYIIGPVAGRHENNLPLINVEDITFNAGSRPDSSGPSGQRGAGNPTRTRLSATNGWGNTNPTATQHAGTANDPIPLSSGESSDNNITEISPISSHTGAYSQESFMQPENELSVEPSNINQG
ncbi:hypothetical protein M422DRAFT_251496 [Sphaerobolus stellatus SS14]|uniref:Unplaced genomic scaffold SPHSTscaffold_39, whole genome shotgun sequence n=1 Tax=Sphaerobolus stellatus (strain SS14) TaxID=990650 RepID=A0A0C9UPP3_SPHS4|nr:hypothetical protein M422DRAFT_251496 [Sphaerobolus stellatus SS14]